MNSAVSREVASLAREVDLVEIRTTGTLARLANGPVPPFGAAMDASFLLRAGVVRGKNNAFDVAFSLDCRPCRAKGERPFARFVYRAVARYRAKQSWSTEVLDAFMRTNALVHLWPYGRHFVQTASAQLGLIPVLLPPFRVRGTKSGPSSPPDAPGE